LGNQLYILDTNILIYYARRGEIARRIEENLGLYVLLTTPILSYVSIAELESFAAQANWGASRLDQLRFILSRFVHIPIDSQGILSAYVTLDVYSRSVGVRMGKNDLWIAATTVATGAVLLTSDLDFEHLHNVFLQRIRIETAPIL
jgi:tRNA(fMet)-specific endonuclease VapC